MHYDIVHLVTSACNAWAEVYTEGCMGVLDTSLDSGIHRAMSSLILLLLQLKSQALAPRFGINPQASVK